MVASRDSAARGASSRARESRSLAVDLQDLAALAVDAVEMHARSQTLCREFELNEVAPERLVHQIGQCVAVVALDRAIGLHPQGPLITSSRL